LADKLTHFLAKSIAKWLEDNAASLDDAYVMGPDFDYDKKPDVSDFSQRVKRVLPFVGIQVMQDLRGAFSVSANILQEADITYNIGVYAADIESLMDVTGEVKQALSSAAHPISNEVGIPLYDFDVVSGSFFDLKGAIDISDLGPSQFFGPSDTDEFENRKHRSITPVIFSAFKDKGAKLIENLGNISIND